MLKAGDWYFVALRRGKPAIHRLAKVKAVTILDETFRRPRRFDLGEAWREAVNSFEASLRRERAVLRVQPQALSRLDRLGADMAEPLRAAKPGRDGVREAEVSIESIGYAASLILGFGGDLVVVSPPELRESRPARRGGRRALFEEAEQGMTRTPSKAMTEPGRRPAVARGGCACGAVRFEIATPAVWAWHDHSRTSGKAQGCAYATYVGSWKSKFRLTDGEDVIARWDEPDTGAVRSFCRRCGTPLFYERAHAPKMINIPRVLFERSVGREPRYHVHIEETPAWAYDNGRLVPLKAYPGVMHQRPTKRSRTLEIGELLGN